MTDYIYREAAINLASDLQIKRIEGYEQYNQAVLNYSAELINLPSADVRPVVLCKQCEFCRAVDKYEFWCLGHGVPYRLIRPDDFCSKGRRKEL